MALSNEIKELLAANIRGTKFPTEIGSSLEVDQVGAFNIAIPINSELKWSPKTTDPSLLGTSSVLECVITGVSYTDSEVVLSKNNQFVTLGGQYGFGTFPSISYSFKDADKNTIISDTGFPISTNPSVKNLTEFAIDPLANRDVNYTVDFVVEFDYSNLAEESVDEIQFDGGTGISILLESSTTDNPARLLTETSTAIDEYGAGDFSVDSGDFIIQTTINEDGKYTLYVDTIAQKAYRKDRFVFNQTVRNFTGEKIGALMRAAIAGTTAILPVDLGGVRPDDPDPPDEPPIIEPDRELPTERDVPGLVPVDRGRPIREKVQFSPADDFIFIDSQGRVLVDSSGITLRDSLLNDGPNEINTKLESIT